MSSEPEDRFSKDPMPRSRPQSRDEWEEERPIGRPPGGSLGSLAQAARKKQLSVARWVLIIIGILNIIVNAVDMGMARGIFHAQVEKEVRALGGRVDPVLVAEAEAKFLRLVYLLDGLGMAIGVVFIVLGILVHRFPVAATISGLTLYIVSQLIMVAVDPNNLYRGIILKVIIVVALAKAIQAAFAYQKDLNDAPPENAYE